MTKEYFEEQELVQFLKGRELTLELLREYSIILKALVNYYLSTHMVVDEDTDSV